MHLYLHIPFCKSRCTYCDFITYANLEHRIDVYVHALCAELAMLASTPPRYTTNALRPSIFFGGGTPGILSLAHLEHLLHIAQKLVPHEHAEITLETNPGARMGTGTGTQDTLSYFRGLRALGINRLSIGVQSLHDPTLRILGRIHTAQEARQCFENARSAGFTAISLDLIYGLPEQTLRDWETTLDTICQWQPDHLSCYSLTLEEHTPLFKHITQGKTYLPDDDTTAAMYLVAMEKLAHRGYTQYEISNWTLHDMCHHNLAYWYNNDYLGAGVAAHGHIYPERYANSAVVDDYIAAVQAGQRPIAETTPLTAADLCAETMFMGLRLNAGVCKEHFRQRCGVELESVYGKTLDELETQVLIERHDMAVRLTAHGRMLGNHVFARFIESNPP